MTLPLPIFAMFDRALEQASSIAPRVDAVFWGLVLASVVLVTVLLVLNLTFIILYREGSKVVRRPLNISEGKVEAVWITGTTLGFLGFFFWGADIYLDLERPPADAYEIAVVGRQWMWDVRHPNGRREFDSLHVPVAQAVRLTLSSEDVIHSFFVPAFRVKQDIVPGKIASTWFKATQKGTYPILCTQYCGTSHAEMIGKVVVMAPEAYAAWLAEGTNEGPGANHGRQLFMRYGCNGCHDQPSPIHAPSLQGIYQQLVPLQNGKFVRADEQYLRDSILLPMKDIAAGYQPIMPSYEGVIPEGDLLEIIGYLRLLTPPPSPSLSPIPISTP